MIRKDLVSREIQKIAEVLARLLNLKKEGRVYEAHELATQALREYFDFDTDELNRLSTGEFLQKLDPNSCAAEKMKLLIDILFESAHPFEETSEIRNRLHLVLALQDKLEEVHHFQSLENISRRVQIDKFLNNLTYE